MVSLPLGLTPIGPRHQTAHNLANGGLKSKAIWQGPSSRWHGRTFIAKLVRSLAAVLFRFSSKW